MLLDDALKISGGGPLPATLVSDWREFLSAPRTLDDLFNHSVLFPLQRKRELVTMLGMAKALKPKAALVVGSDKAGDAWSFLNACPTLECLIAIEIRGVPWTDEFRRAFPKVDFITIADSSYASGTVSRVESLLQGIDFAFLDGHKSHYLDDFNAYLPMMRKPGGIVFMHDAWPHGDNFPCADVFRSLATKYRTELILDVSEHEEALRREIKDGEHFENSYWGWLHYWAKIQTCGVGVIYL